MKYLLIAVLLAGLNAGTCVAQVSPPDPSKPTYVFRSTIAETRAFDSLPDTSSATAAALLAPGTRLHVLNYATSKWVVCTHGSSRYLVPVAALGDPEKETADTPPIGNSGVLVGPRGGLYRLNSKGNKTYIKH